MISDRPSGKKTNGVRVGIEERASSSPSTYPAGASIDAYTGVSLDPVGRERSDHAATANAPTANIQPTACVHENAAAGGEAAGSAIPEAVADGARTSSISSRAAAAESRRSFG